jgi:hypothetical protein
MVNWPVTLGMWQGSTSWWEHVWTKTVHFLARMQKRVRRGPGCPHPLQWHAPNDLKAHIRPHLLKVLLPTSSAKLVNIITWAFEGHSPSEL